ncbi:condensation domain-containing protein [Butyrivibrio sp. DSM 10294]|uniref:condensation domain-containing protein n=1 Tax=Butyrivibrio sp. DSM 10294 TaxID=2972457 RepID=UPI00234E3A72|nr:condensation domain-containing protein [Butyrivibrio sp. DSM 10294]MDC7291996.1 condensation domain-containing protein [Butyrivibrio sp. DSM 10294]
MSDRKYLYTERAHYMCPNMHFGIVAEIGAEFDENRIIKSIDVLRSAHPLMRSLIAKEQGSSGIYYEEQSELEIPVTIKKVNDNWQTDYEAVSSAGWNVQKEALLKVFAYPSESGTRVLFITHHLLCDGRGLLQLVREFADYYANDVKPQPVDEKLMESLNDLPDGSNLGFISKLLIKGANKKWRKEGHKVSYEEYLKFERDHDSKQDIKREIMNIDEEELDTLLDLCRENGVSLNDYLVAKMMIDESTDRVVIASDIRNKIKNYKEGALGNYATAFGVVVKKKSSEIIELAKAVDHEVGSIISKPDKEMLVLSCYFNMDPELLDAIAISTLGNFESKAGRFVGSKMFGYEKRDGHCITNLGRVESSVISEAIFIPPASPANRKAWGVLTINKKMRICSIHSR